jgi:hypothetical protein
MIVIDCEITGCFQDRFYFKMAKALTNYFFKSWHQAVAAKFSRWLLAEQCMVNYSSAFAGFS